MTPTVTPYPTLTPFPTSAATPALDLEPVMIVLDAGSLGPSAVQAWDMSVAPHWGAISLAFQIMLVVGIFLIFYSQFREG